MLIDPENALAPILLYDLTVYDPAISGTRTLHYADREFRTGASDTPASTVYRNRISNPGTLAIDLVSAWAKGIAALGIGTITLNNPDGALDALRAYVFDGYGLTVSLGTFALDGTLSVTRIFKGAMEQPDFDLETITIIVRSLSYRLDRAMLTNRFLGTGGLEGDSALAGKIKRVVYGFVYNATLIPVDATNLIYFLGIGGNSNLQLTADPLDAGLPLTFSGTTCATTADLIAASVPPGEYARCYTAAGSYIKLGSLPNGELTADLNTTATTPGDVIAAILTAASAQESGVSGRYQSLTASVLVAGISIEDDTTTYADALAKLTAGFAGWIWLNIDARGGAFDTNFWIVDNMPYDATVSSVAVTVDDSSIVAFKKLGNPNSIGDGIPPWSVTLNYRKNETVQTSGLAPTVPLATRNLLGSPTQQVNHQDPTIQVAYPLAESVIIEGNLDSAGVPSVMQEVCDHLFTALTTPRDFYQITVRLSAALLAAHLPGGPGAGAWVPAMMPTMSTITYPPNPALVLGVRSNRFGFATTGKGTHCWVMAVSLDLQNKTVTYVVWTTYRAG